MGIGIVIFLEWDGADSPNPSAAAGRGTLADVIRQSTRLRLDLAEALAQVTDKDSAIRADAKLNKLADRAEALTRELEAAFSAATPSSEEFIAATTNPEYVRATKRVYDEMTRVVPYNLQRELAYHPVDRARHALSQYDRIFEAAMKNSRFAGKPMTAPAQASNPALGETSATEGTSPATTTATEPGSKTGRYRLSHISGDTAYNVLVDQLHNFGGAYRDDQYVIVRLNRPHPDQYDNLAARLQEIVGVGVTMTGSPTLRALAPVEEIETFAACIDFGTVKRTNPSARLIEVDVDSNWEFTAGTGPTLNSPRKGS